MKNIHILLLALLFISCTEPKYRYIGQTIIDGKVSATQKGSYGRNGTNPIIWVQDSISTQEITIPFEFEGKWKVGDSCLLIIEKYEIVKEK
jgi:hypothetical protein